MEKITVYIDYIAKVFFYLELFILKMIVKA
jgi:hypothetical protein